MKVVSAHLPRGSGFDCGTKFDFDRSRPDRLVFTTEFHHMNEHGMYDGWSAHDVFVKPSFIGGFDLRITGPDRNQIKGYVAEMFEQALSAHVGQIY